jgi:hypothetical protein
LPVIALHNSRHILVTGCAAAPGTPTFLGLSGKGTAGISLVGNDLREAAGAVIQTEEVPSGAVNPPAESTND